MIVYNLLENIIFEYSSFDVCSLNEYPIIV